MKGSASRSCAFSRSRRRRPLRHRATFQAMFRSCVESRLVVAEEAPSAPNAPVLHKMPRPAPRLDVMKERYPLLRNAM